MVSQSEVAVVKANGNSASARRRSKNTSGASTKSAKARSTKRNPKAPTGTDIVPVMKLKAIDIVDSQKGGKGKKSKQAKKRERDVPQILHMPPPQSDESATVEAGEPIVTDPELLELLQQLSETIDTANTVLEVAASEVEPPASGSYQNGAGNGGATQPATEPVPPDEIQDDDPPMAAGTTASHSAPEQRPDARKSGLGLVAKSALAGLVLAAGAAWILHTNPWILDEVRGGVTQIPVKISASPSPASNDRTAAIQPPPPTPNPKRETATVAAVSTGAIPVPTRAEQAAKAPVVAIDKAAEPVLTSPGQSVALDIAVDPGPGALETSVMVQGVPADARLSSGKSLGSGNWLLKAEELVGLRLVTGEATPQGLHGMEFMVVRNDGSVPRTQAVDIIISQPDPGPAARPQQQTAKATQSAPVRPVRQTAVARQAPAAKAKPVPAAQEKAATEASAPLSPAEARTLLTRGTALLEGGDVDGARLLLEYAAQRGNKDAMVMLAQSYDPKHLSKLPVVGVRPNEQMAARWYDRAANANR